MRRRFVLVAVLGLWLSSACSSPAVRSTVDAPPAGHVPPEAPALSGPPPTPVQARPVTTSPLPALPEPIPIPADSYAPERVVEIGTMEIPAIGLKHRLFEGVTLHNIDRGPSHWPGSAMPGQLGNAVFAGHRSTRSEPFRRIDDLVAGDKVIFNVGRTRSTYRVTGHLVVRPADSWIADQTHAYTATLYACHPVGSMAERYVVRLELVQG